MNTQKTRSLSYYHRNRDAINLRRRELYKTEERRRIQAKIRMRRFRKNNPLYDKSYYEENPEKFRHRKEVSKKYSKNLKLSNPGLYKKRIDYITKTKKYRYHNDPEFRKKEIRRLGLLVVARQHSKRTTGKLTKTIIEELQRKAEYKCKYCGKSEKDGIKLSVDHIVPVSKGGTNEISNLQILCMPCNQRKYVS